MKNQASQLREMVERARTEVPDGAGPLSGVAMRPPSKKRAVRPLSAKFKPDRHTVLSFTGGKGGVGKTCLAVNFAIDLARLFDLRTALIDLDLGLANADILLGLNPKRTISDVLSDRYLLSEIVMEGPGGVHLVPGGNGIRELANLSFTNRERLVKIFSGLAAEYDVVIIDTGAGVDANTLRFASAADEVIVVTTDEPTAVLDAYSEIKLLRQEEECGQVNVLLNQIRNPERAADLIEQFKGIIREYMEHEVRSLGFVPHDEAVRYAVSRRIPFSIADPRCDANRALVRAAATILSRRRKIDLSGVGQITQPRTGFVNRLARILGF